MTGLQIAAIAQICHEANRAFCASIGDYTQLPWGVAPEWQRDSVINGVNFHLAALDRGDKPKPEESHENWMREKIAAGWKYGPVKDAEKKEHPCIVPYKELPAEQQTKHHLFMAIVSCLYDQL